MIRPTGTDAISRRHSSLPSCFKVKLSEYMVAGCPEADGRPKSTKSLLAGTPGVVLVAEDADRVGRGLGTALHAQLGEQGRHVVLHGLLSQEHSLADLPVC